MKWSNLHRHCLQEVLRLNINLLFFIASFKRQTIEHNTSGLLDFSEHPFFCSNIRDESIPNDVFFPPPSPFHGSLSYIQHPKITSSYLWVIMIHSFFSPCSPLQPSLHNGRSGSSLTVGICALSRPSLSLQGCLQS